MDQDVAVALADIRQQLGELRSALGANSADDAEKETARLRSVVRSLAAWAAAQGWVP